jgi:hypothetical protein
MEEKQLTPAAAFEIVYRATGALQLNRADNQILEASLRILASLIPSEVLAADKSEAAKK